MFERLGGRPGLAGLLRFRLQVTPREVDADTVTEDVIACFSSGNVSSAAAHCDNQLNFVMHVGRERRVGEILARQQNIVGVFLKEERCLAIRVMAHFASMGCIVAADTIDPAHRKADGTTRDRQQDEGRGCQNGLHERPAPSFSLGFARRAGSTISTHRIPPWRNWSDSECESGEDVSSRNGFCNRSGVRMCWSHSGGAQAQRA